MSIVPTGLPAWLRANGHTAYGGNINKTNYQSVGTINPRTDLSAENLCRIAADLAAVARTAPFATMTFVCNDTVVGPPTIEKYYSMVGGAPTGVRSSAGVVYFQWAQSYADDYGVSGNANIIAAVATPHATTPTGPVAMVDISSFLGTGINDTVTVTVVDTAFAAVPDARVSLTIWTG